MALFLLSNWRSKVLYRCFSEPNYNNLSNTDNSDTESNPIVSIPDVMRREADKVNAYAELIRENLAIDILVQREPMDRELIEGIYDLVLETVFTTSPEIVIASSRYPVELVKSKFLKPYSGYVEWSIWWIA